MAQTRLLVGTRKALFIYTSDERREKWEVSDPLFTGWSVYNAVGDRRSDPMRLYAAANHWAWGPSVVKSEDLGKTWEQRSTGLGFAPDSGKTVQNVWNVASGHDSEPGVVYAGTQPAGLFRSEDWGHSWSPVEALHEHPSSKWWSGTGGGDSCAHSLHIDPRDAQRMWIAVSAGGSFRTRDGGRSWEMFSHTAVPATEKALEFTKTIVEQFPDAAPEGVDPLAVNEMHKMRVDTKNPDRIWTQTHVGVFRSDDAGDTWEDVTGGLPSFHGFPIAVSKSGPDAAYVVPLAFAGFYDNFRVCDGQFTVYRTQDSGKTWQPLTKGLPGPHDYQSSYREAMDTDDEGGVYVGTTNGEIYGSTDGGDTWRRLPGTLPPILSLATA